MGPADGDVIITKDTAGRKTFTLGVVPGPPQVRCQTFEQAVATGERWARERRVAIWFTEDGKVFTVIEATGTSVEQLLCRVRGEFLEMPGLRLTCEQAQRLCGLDHKTCLNLLNTLVDLEFLICRSDGTYARLTEGSPPED